MAYYGQLFFETPNLPEYSDILIILICVILQSFWSSKFIFFVENDFENSRAVCNLNQSSHLFFLPLKSSPHNNYLYNTY